MHSLGHAIGQGIKNLFRNRLYTLASIGTITACLFLFGLFFCMIMNFRSFYTEIETTVGVTVFFDQGVDETQILDIKGIIEKREEVDKVEYTSAEEAWEQYKKEVFPEGETGDMSDILENLDDDNPLKDSASLEVYMKDVTKQGDLVKYIEKIDGVRQVNSSETLANSLGSLGRLVGYVSLALIIILVAVAIFLISNTVMIGITVRKDEIAIMKYLGATNFFVKGPFLVEGMLIGFIGSAIPVAVLYFLYNKVVDFIVNNFGALSKLLTFLPAKPIFILLLPASVIIGVVIGFIGSSATLAKHVKV